MGKKVIDIKTLRKLQGLNRMEDLKKLENLEDILENEYNMEINDSDKPFISIEDNIIAYSQAIQSDEFGQEDKDRMSKEMMLFKPFLDKDLYCTFCCDSLRGILWGMGYAIVNARLELIEFIEI